MSIPTEDLQRVLTHFIDPQNLPVLKKDRILRCALDLMSDTEKKHWACKQRKACLTLSNGVVLRDQKPLNEKRIEFCDETTFPQYVCYLNQHVFFWTDTSDSKKRMCGFSNNYDHHAKLRFSLDDLQKANPQTEFLYSRYNSGAAPQNPNNCPRYLGLFKPLETFSKNKPVEIVVKGEVRLPDNTEYQAAGSWQKLFPHDETFPNLPPIRGVRLAVAKTGMKYKNRDDLMLAEFAENTVASGVFTQSSTASASIDWCRRQIESQAPRALLVNAGNANAFTGQIGHQHVAATCDAVSAALDCQAEQVLVASTGVIGEPLAVEKITDAVPQLAQSLTEDAWQPSANAIRTTDTFAKGATAEAMIADVPVRINGFAKGSGMIEPNMATMLAFLFTDAAILPPLLRSLLVAANAKSFNAITVDSDTSTNDTCLIFATGQANNPTPDDPLAYHQFQDALQRVMTDLAVQIVRDGEGAQKLITITVRGAESDLSAKIIAKSIANSPLVKTAIAGGDANWGRIVMAVGKSAQPVDQSRLSISIGGIRVAEHGQCASELDESVVNQHLTGTDILIEVELELSDGYAQVWTCDLTDGYLEINANYRS